MEQIIQTKFGEAYNTPSGVFLKWPHKKEKVLAGVSAGWEDPIVSVIKKVVKSRQSVIDIGANFGTICIPVSRFSKRVYAFEPEPKIFGFLERNIIINEISNIQVYNVACYSTQCCMGLDKNRKVGIRFTTKERLAVDYDRCSNISSITFVPKPDGAIQAVRVDDTPGLSGDDIGFIKVDAQGADFRALEGCVETIKRCRPHIIMEVEEKYMGRFGWALNDALTFFDALSYKHTAIGRRRHDYLFAPA